MRLQVRRLELMKVELMVVRQWQVEELLLVRLQAQWLERRRAQLVRLSGQFEEQRAVRLVFQALSRVIIC